MKYVSKVLVLKSTKILEIKLKIELFQRFAVLKGVY